MLTWPRSAVGCFAAAARAGVEAAAVRFQDQGALQRHRAAGARVTPPGRARTPRSPAGVTAIAVATGLGLAAGRGGSRLSHAVLAAATAAAPGLEPGAGLARPVERFQSGVINDYMTWIVVGMACLGGALAVAIR